MSSIVSDPALLLTLAFALAVMAGLLVRFWLASRQIRHVASHRDAVPQAFAQQVSLAAHQRAADYTVTKMRVGLFETAFAAVVLLGWTLLGGLDALNQWLLGMLGGGMVQQLALLAAFALIGGALDLPFSLWQTFVVEQRYGFNKMSLGLWLRDLVVATAVSLVLGLPIAALILWIMGSTGAWWWLWAWAAFTAYQLVVMLIFPNFIAPLFNKFKPLEDETLRTRIAGLMQRTGFQARGIFVMDGSRRSAHANAYFTGLGKTKRVVFYDTLLAKLSPPEMDAVLAHELGHFTHRHITKRMVMIFVASLLGFALLGWLTTRTWFYVGLGVRPNFSADLSAVAAPSDALALTLFMLAVPVFTFFLSPVFARFSRRDEYQADAFAVSQTSGHDLAAALLKLHEDNASTLTPDPVFVNFYYSHPPASERLARMVPGMAT